MNDSNLNLPSNLLTATERLATVITSAEPIAAYLQAKARLYRGTMPEVVNMPLGQGHLAYGRWAKGRGANPKRIIGNEYDYLGGLATWSSTRVRIYKA